MSILFAVLLTSTAGAMPCNELQQLLEAGVPEPILVDTLEYEVFDPDEEQCLESLTLTPGLRRQVNEGLARWAESEASGGPGTSDEELLRTGVFDWGVSSKEVDQYCMVTAYQPLLSSRVVIAVDTGAFGRFVDKRIRDETGRVARFNSVVDALNYMAIKDWEFVDAYAVSTGKQNVYHYLMKKKVLVHRPE